MWIYISCCKCWKYVLKSFFPFSILSGSFIQNHSQYWPFLHQNWISYWNLIKIYEKFELCWIHKKEIKTRILGIKIHLGWKFSRALPQAPLGDLQSSPNPQLFWLSPHTKDATRVLLAMLVLLYYLRFAGAVPENQVFGDAVNYYS